MRGRVCHMYAILAILTEPHVRNSGHSHRATCTQFWPFSLSHMYAILAILTEPHVHNSGLSHRASYTQFWPFSQSHMYAILAILTEPHVHNSGHSHRVTCTQFWPVSQSHMYTILAILTEPHIHSSGHSHRATCTQFWPFSQRHMFTQFWPFSQMRRADCCAYVVLKVGLSNKEMTVMCKVGQNRMYTPYMTVYLVNSLPNIPYIHRIYNIHRYIYTPCILRYVFTPYICMVLANPSRVSREADATILSTVQAKHSHHAPVQRR